MSVMYPTHVKASHINTVASLPPRPSSPFFFMKFLLQYALNWYTPEEKEGLKRTQWWQTHGNGYFNLQSTKPQTVGYSLADSPVGMMAWIYEKLHDWTDGYAWTDEEVCTWVSVYWFSTAGPAASTRIYRESTTGEFPLLEKHNGFGSGVKVVSRNLTKPPSLVHINLARACRISLKKSCYYLNPGLQLLDRLPSWVSTSKEVTLRLGRCQRFLLEICASCSVRVEAHSEL